MYIENNCISPVEFKLLFSGTERVAIRALRPTDPIVADFMDIIDDPRLSKVDLAIKSTQDALDYLTFVGVLAAGRKAQILMGVVG